MKIIEIYRTETGRAPFSEWMNSLKDRAIKQQLKTRLARLEENHFGDYKSVGEGVFELRIFCGPGFRIYFAKHGQFIVLLLCGGDKNTQTRDIQKAKTYWEDFKENIS